MLQSSLVFVTVDNTYLKEKIDRLNIDRDKLMMDRDTLITERNKPTAERDDLRTRLAANKEETRHAIDTFRELNAELEGDKQMPQESIALLKKTREAAVRTVCKTYEDLLIEMKEEK
jgi:hypothetical protein